MSEADRRADREQYGEKKERYTFMLTRTASDKLNMLAEKMNLTRSEVFEQAIRKAEVTPNREDIATETPQPKVANQPKKGKTPKGFASMVKSP